MRSTGEFKLVELELRISGNSRVNITLCLPDPDQYRDYSAPISGFPREIVADEMPLCQRILYTCTLYLSDLVQGPLKWTVIRRL